MRSSPRIDTESNDSAGFDLFVNAAPFGISEGDSLLLDVSRLSSSTFVGELMMKPEMTTFLRALSARGCVVEVGTDMLRTHISAYLEFFGLPVPKADER